MTHLVDTLIEDHLNGKVERWHVFHNDPMYHAYLQMLRRALSECDTALAAAGRGEAYRRELINLVMSGPPDTDAALQRIAEHAARVDELSKQTGGPYLVTPPDGA